MASITYKIKYKYQHGSGTEVTVNHTIAELANEYSWANGNYYTDFDLDYENATPVVNIKALQDEETTYQGYYHAATQTWRMYQYSFRKNGHIVISVNTPGSYYIKEVKITYTPYNDGYLTDPSYTETYDSDEVIEVDAYSFTTYVSKTSIDTQQNGQARVTAISVTYVEV